MGETKKTEKKGARQSINPERGLAEAAVFRILDASINRACEGLRVVEDYARMLLNDVFLSKQLKQLRHDLVSCCMDIDADKRLQSRDSETDVGRNVRTESEYSREDFESLIRSNMTRVQQAARTIEEYSKSRFPSVAMNVEQIRYRAYTLEKAVFNTAHNRARFQNAKLYVLVDLRDETSGFTKLSSLVGDLVKVGVDVIQFRNKTLADRELVTIGKMIKVITDESPTQLVINDRVDLCVAIGADGVHLGQDDLSVSQARKILHPNQFIGVSTHSIEQARKAVIDGADYIGVGPVFPSQTKSFDSHVGTELVAEVVNEVSLPAFAIGGIDSSNVQEVVDAGCSRVAVSSAVCKSASPAESARELLKLLAK